MTEYILDSPSLSGTSAAGSPSGISQSSGITGRQPKGASSNGTASSVASIESPVLKVSPAELSRLSNVLVQSVDVTRYYDSYEFDNASLTEGKFYFGGGYVSFHSGGAVEYSAIVSDYRGSTRVVLSAAGGPLQQSVQQLNGYYPSGALVADYQTSRLGGTSSADVQTRKFTGKELDRMHGLDWHDFGARRYDAAAVFFTSPDPLSEKYYHINPYVYCAGNPVNRLDPDGRDWYGVKQVEQIDDKAVERYTVHYTDCSSQEEMDKNNIQGEYLGTRVVVFNGYYDEKLGDDNHIDGPNSKSATATVYGNTSDDICDYDAFTMSSNFEKNGAIKDGVYDGNWRDEPGSGKIPKHYILNSGRPIDTIDGNRTPKEKGGYSPTQKDGICIHRTNIGDNAYGSDERYVSTGCLLIPASQWNDFENQLGKNKFKVILQRK